MNHECDFVFPINDTISFDGQVTSPQMTIRSMSMDLKQHVGIRVRAARQKRQLTQERVGEMVGKTAESISNIERGHVLPPLDTLYSIAQHLDVPMGFFFEDMDRPNVVARNRMEVELRFRTLAEELKDDELRLVVAVIEAIKNQRH